MTLKQVQCSHDSYLHEPHELTVYTAQRDAAKVKELTKSEMIEFYSTYIKPTSPTRAKLVVQLIAQGISPKVKEAEELSNGDTSAIWSNGTEPLLIRNVRDYKARLSVTAGARPIRDLSEFEEVDSKL